MSESGSALQDHQENDYCALCGQPVKFWIRAGNHDYLRCPSCELVRKTLFPGPERERNRYLEHNNDPGESGYRNYLLGKFETRLKPQLAEDSLVVDYGCGEHPSLEIILNQEYPALRVLSYDPIFHPVRPETRERTRDGREVQRSEVREQGIADAIYCNETAEHFFNPRAAFEHMRTLIKPGGILYLGTHSYDSEEESFSRWWYLRDPTHVHFYNLHTIKNLDSLFGFELVQHHLGKEFILRRRRRV